MVKASRRRRRRYSSPGGGRPVLGNSLDVEVGTLKKGEREQRRGHSLHQNVDELPGGSSAPACLWRPSNSPSKAVLFYACVLAFVSPIGCSSCSGRGSKVRSASAGFAAFYAMSELWGSVVLLLLFWGLPTRRNKHLMARKISVTRIAEASSDGKEEMDP